MVKMEKEMLMMNGGIKIEIGKMVRMGEVIDEKKMGSDFGVLGGVDDVIMSGFVIGEMKG